VRHSPAYSIVRLANGACSVRSLDRGETFHPAVGPVAEAEALYVRQLRLPERVREAQGEFVIWDVGLGAAANVLTAIRLIRQGLAAPAPGSPAAYGAKRLRIVSFDRSPAALTFALQHGSELGYLAGYESAAADLARDGSAILDDGPVQIQWTAEWGDFPAALAAMGPPTARIPAPHAILFDPHSPRANPEMWTVGLFTSLFRRLDPIRPCNLATFSRSTMARVAMLLGGFFVGVGHPSGLKEETTLAANRLDLIETPLDPRWLERGRRSGSAEPMIEPVYRQAPLSPESWDALRQHPQFHPPPADRRKSA
jgi:tRNA U34 5-methylaminomethyl-2-thiouridine-forming methyltransferase MnmC